MLKAINFFFIGLYKAMKIRSCAWVLIFAFGICIQCNVFAQKNPKKYKTKSVQIDTDAARSTDFVFHFNNLNKSFYHNTAELQIIQKYEDKKDYQALLPV